MECTYSALGANTLNSSKYCIIRCFLILLFRISTHKKVPPIAATSTLESGYAYFVTVFLILIVEVYAFVQ